MKLKCIKTVFYSEQTKQQNNILFVSEKSQVLK